MLRKIFVRLLGDERGVTLVEYGIAVTLAVIVGGGVLATLGGAINGELGAAQNVMSPGSYTTP